MRMSVFDISAHRVEYRALRFAPRVSALIGGRFTPTSPIVIPTEAAEKSPRRVSARTADRAESHRNRVSQQPASPPLGRRSGGACFSLPLATESRCRRSKPSRAAARCRKANGTHIAPRPESPRLNYGSLCASPGTAFTMSLKITTTANNTRNTNAV